MNFYRVLRDNKEIGPYSLDEITKLGLRSSDLIWVDGQSAAWRFPDEVPGLISLIENPLPKAEDSALQATNTFSSKPKKRYRLTADHRMVEITEEEASQSNIPRIEEQPPAPKSETKRQPSLEERLAEKKENDDIVPFEDIPFGRKNVVEDNSFPLEPELSKGNSDDKNDQVSYSSVPFTKRNELQQDQNDTFPLEPQLDPSKKTVAPIEDFVDVDKNNETEMEDAPKTPSNTGAFVLAGLLFLVAIAFFGYKWYKDQDGAQSVATADRSDSTKASDSTLSDGPNGFSKSKSIALNDDTLGQQQRIASRKTQDSIKRLELAKARLAQREKAKADSIQNALAANSMNDDTDDAQPVENKPAKPAITDTTKEKKVNKIRTTEDIGKYVRVGVVQPKSQDNGVTGVKLVVHNINNRNLAKVHINVLYYDNNGKVIKKSDIIAPNITIGNSVTVPVADNSSASYVSYKVTGLLGDHVNLQAK